MSVIIALVVILYLVFFAFGFISYAFYSYGLYEIAKKESEKNPALAWIPYINKYTLGRIAFKSNMQGGLLAILGIINIVLSLLVLFIKATKTILLELAIASIVISTALAIYTFVARYRVYKKYSKSTILMTILDIISCGILGPFFIFAIRNNESK